MAFPASPDPRGSEPESLFRVQDPFGLRRVITPVFLTPLDNRDIVGLGTSFSISPFGFQLSALHIVTDVIEGRHAPAVRRDGNLTLTDAQVGVFHDPGLVFGTMRTGHFVPFQRMVFLPKDQTADPLAVTFTREQLNRVEPMLDLLYLELGPAPPNKPYSLLPVDIGGRTYLREGDKVMAVGYPEIVGKTKSVTATEIVRRMQESMFASVATVTKLYRTSGPGHNKWPTIEVDQDWPPGMSGGPIFDIHGNVVGVVSRGGPYASYGVWLQALAPELKFFDAIDASNPGWVKGWCVYEPSTWRVRGFFPDKPSADARAAEIGDGVQVAFGSHRPGTDELMLCWSY